MATEKHVRICEDFEQLAACAANWLRRLIVDFSRDNGRPFVLSLSGGSTPRRLYDLLAVNDPEFSIDWNRVYLIWGDERNVPPDHPDSNFRMVQESLLDKIDIPAANVLAVPNPGGDPHEAAQRYEALLNEKLPRASDSGQPVLDLVLLGLGDDVHTASLFPETDALQESQRWCVANFVPKLGTWRITLTAPAINSARQVAFLVSGSKKRDAMKVLWHGPRDTTKYPAQLIDPPEGALWYWADQDAVADLSPPVDPEPC